MSDDGIKTGKFVVVINRGGEYCCHFCSEPLNYKFITLIRIDNVYYPICPVCEIDQ
jgi:hypothetical protein